MSNYIAVSRSNYFRVMDDANFKKWCANHRIEWSSKDDATKGRMYMITPFSEDADVGWNQVSDPFSAEPDFKRELALHLDPRDIITLIEVGGEKACYVIACAWAIRADGEMIFVDLQEALEKRARECFGDQIEIADASD